MVKWSSRKFISAWSLTLLFTLLLWFSKVTDQVYGNSVSFIWLGYFAGNVGDKFMEKRNGPTT